MTDMSERQALASLFKKKAAVMQALEGGMAKTGKNDHFDYKFVTASDIKRVVSHLFAQHGISLQMSGIATENVVYLVETKDFKTKEVRTKEVPILRVQFAITLCDVDTGATEQSFWFGEAGATDDKAASKAATSALKYYLIDNLMIADKDEDKRDTDRDANKRRAETPPPPQAPAAPHWSMDDATMERLYTKAYDTHKMDVYAVQAAIAAAGKPITSLTEKDAWAIVTGAAKKTGVQS